MGTERGSGQAQAAGSGGFGLAGHGLSWPISLAPPGPDRSGSAISSRAMTLVAWQAAGGPGGFAQAAAGAQIALAGFGVPQPGGFDTLLTRWHLIV